ncbi:hypothetical protein Q8A67_020645 [Cirrhinus molitorella]|uniref:Uncharacterized protein n=1 Tax=Cirrhinus molitorella TaxID=172907 RepID=A0AA88P5L0_9TELE|nr:hypothetical protein Q8A67_020645 [Cirrhinus molitorella]
MKTLSSPSEHLNAQVRIGESVPLVKPGLVCATPSTEEFSFPTIHSTTFHLTASTKDAERRRSGVSNTSERGVEREREMVNPEWSWSGVISKILGARRGNCCRSTPLTYSGRH